MNRLLFPYFLAFFDLLEEGIAIEKIDASMSAFGWPMGPGQLLDVIGLDVIQHSADILGKAYPDRMKLDCTKVVDPLCDAGRLGQKTGVGLYVHERDVHGRLRSILDTSVYEIVSCRAMQDLDISSEELVRKMIDPITAEADRCIDEGIIASPEELNLAMFYGAGYPGTRGGPASSGRA